MRRRFPGLSFLADYQDPPEPGSCEGYPLRIHNVLQINTTTPLWITSPTEVSINGIPMVFKKPLLLSKPLDTRIISTQPLGPAFANGWSKLPKELKVQILAYNLVTDSELGVSVGPNNQKEYYRSLHMTPEIAEIAEWVFYKMNTFCIQETRRAPPLIDWINYRFPPPMFASRICKVVICVEVTSSLWDRLSHVARGFHGLSNLSHVTVRLEPFRGTIGIPDGRWVEVNRYSYTIRFRCRGELIMSGLEEPPTSPSALQPHPLVRQPSVQDRMNFLKSRISFLP